MTESPVSTPVPQPAPQVSSMNKRLLVSLFLVGLFLVLGGLGFQGLSALKKPPVAKVPLPKVYNVETYHVDKKNLQEQISSFGTARADREVIVSAQVSGEVVQFSPRLKSLEVGQLVKGPTPATGESKNPTEGELLLVINPDLYLQQAEQANKRLAVDAQSLQRLDQEIKNNSRTLLKAEEDFKEYTEEYNKVKKLFDDKVASASQLTRAKLELGRYKEALNARKNEKALIPLRKKELEKQEEVHQNDLKMAQINLAHTKVIAPLTGTIREVMVELGSFVRTGEPLLKITKTSHIEIPVPVTLTDYAKIEQILQYQKEVAVRIATHETARYSRTGRITRIAPVANAATRTVNLFVEVDNTDSAITKDQMKIHGSLGQVQQQEQLNSVLPGMFVHTRIEGPVLQNVVILPREAILYERVFVVSELDLNQELKRIDKRLNELKKPSGKNNQSQLSELKRQKVSLISELKALPENQNGRVKIASERKVQVQRTLQTFAIIQSGLKPGEQVILTNLDIMHNGARIRVESKRTIDQELKKQRIPVIRSLTKDNTTQKQLKASPGG